MKTISHLAGNRASTYRRGWVILLCVICLCPAWAATEFIIRQPDGQEYLAFEAETYSSLTRNGGANDGFNIVSPGMFTSAFGSTVLPASGSFQASGGKAILADFRYALTERRSTIVYKLIFSTPGTYRMYYRYSLFENNVATSSYGGENSFYFSPSFGAAATASEGTTLKQDGSGEGVPLSNPVEGQYFWRNAGDEFVVQRNDVGRVLVFTIEDREFGWSLDRFVFSRINDLDIAETGADGDTNDLDGLTNSPASVTIFQKAGANFMAFEAEDFNILEKTGTADQGFGVVGNDEYVTAFGSTALPAASKYPATDFTAVVSDPDTGGAEHCTKMTYNLVFQTAGTYRFYFRYSLFERTDTSGYGNEDSFYFSPSFGATATASEGTTAKQDGSGTGYPLTNPIEGEFYWRNSGDSFTVTSDNLGKILTFQIDNRENGWALDKIVFSTSTSLDVVEKTGDGDKNDLCELANSGTNRYIIQNSGQTYIAFEAENFDRLFYNVDANQGWKIVNQSDFTTAFGTTVLPASGSYPASGNTAIIADPRYTSSIHNSTLTYNLVFMTAGTYRFYFRFSIFERLDTASYGSEDSFYYSPTFGAAATDQEGTRIKQDGSGEGFPLTNPFEGQYFWCNSGNNFTVSAADVGKVLAFTVDTREAGWSLDRIVFSTNASLDVTEAGGNALCPLANSTVSDTPASIRYRLYFKEKTDRLLTTVYTNPDTWVANDKVTNVAQMAACLARLYQWTGDSYYLNSAVDFLEAIVYDASPSDAEMFTCPPLMDAYLRLESQLSSTLRADFENYIDTYFDAASSEVPGDHNRAFSRAAGFEMAWDEFGNDSGLHNYALTAWDFFYSKSDCTENATNYNRLDLVYLIMLSDALGQSSYMSGSNPKAYFARYRDHVSPAGAIGSYGDSGALLTNPDWPTLNHWGFWCAAFEWAATKYSDATFRWAAEKLSTAGMHYESIGDEYEDSAELWALGYADQWQTATLTPVQSAAASAILTRKEKNYAGTVVTASDKLVLNSSRKSYAPFLMSDLYARGSHAHTNQQGAITYFENKNMSMLSSLGYHNINPGYANLLLMMPAADAFPVPDPHYNANQWYTIKMPTSRMTPSSTSNANQRFIDAITLRVESAAGVQFSADNIYLTGPSGTVTLDSLNATTGWGGSPTDMGSYLRWNAAAGIVKFTKDFNYTFDCTQYTHLQISWMLSDNAEWFQPFILMIPEPGAQYHCEVQQLQPTLTDSAVASSGDDQFGRMNFSKWFTEDSSLIRSFVLTAEGILVIKDVLTVGTTANGYQAGPVWNLMTTAAPETGTRWFSSQGTDQELLVWFNDISGTYACKTMNILGRNDQRTVYAKRTVSSGTSYTFISVLVPHPSYVNSSTLAGGISVAVSGTDHIVTLTAPEGKEIDISIGTGNTWSVTR